MDSIEVPADLMRYKRRDTAHVDSNQRPTQDQYDRFITIIQYGRQVGWNHHDIHSNGPFLMADPGVQFIFLRANRDLLELARRLELTDAYDEIQEWIQRVEDGCSWLWNDDIGGYCARDIRSGRFSDAITNASMLCFYGDVGSDEQRASMAAHCRRILNACRYGMPSWEDELANRIQSDTRQLVEMNGMAEYFDPMDGTGLGGMDFSWTAAIYLDQSRDSVAAHLQNAS